MASNVIFDFDTASDLKKWVIVDDVVMGGKSSGSFTLSPEGHGVFEGFVSLANNGGFSSVRHKFERKPVKSFSEIVLNVKGDGKNYQCRIKANSTDYYSYVSTFATNGDWQEIHIPLAEMYPSFRGRKLDQPNFSEGYLEEIAFLIGNKKEEGFELMIDKIGLK
ncbi:MAG: CIA30 family protein [Bacteroidota bacterium]